MDLRQLSHFRVVAEQGSFSKAAEILGMGQPGLTKSVRRLEERLGVKLLERRARGVDLTEFGAVVLRHAKLIDVEHREALSEVEALLGGRVGRISVGAGPAWLGRLLPEAVSRLHDARPRVRVRVVTGYPEELREALQGGDLDLVVGAIPEDPRSQGLESVALAADDQTVVARAGHPLARRRRSTLSDLLDYPWVMAPAWTQVRRRIESYFMVAALTPPEPAVETDSLPFTMALLRSGDFLGVTTRAGLGRPEAHDLAVVTCPEMVFRRTTGVVYRRRGTLPAAAAALIAELRAVCADGEPV